MWEAIVWVFYNVIPWVWLVLTIIYFIVSAIIAYTEKDEYLDAIEFTQESAGLSFIVNIIGLLIVFAVASLTEKVVNQKRQKP